MENGKHETGNFKPINEEGFSVHGWPVFHF
jgi:hypothetical protein